MRHSHKAAQIPRTPSLPAWCRPAEHSRRQPPCTSNSKNRIWTEKKKKKKGVCPQERKSQRPAALIIVSTVVLKKATAVNIFFHACSVLPGNYWLIVLFLQFRVLDAWVSNWRCSSTKIEVATFFGFHFLDFSHFLSLLMLSRSCH